MEQKWFGTKLIKTVEENNKTVERKQNLMGKKYN